MINSPNANPSLFSDQTYSLEYSLNDNFSLEDYLKDENAILCAKKMGPQAKKYFNSEKIKQLIKYATEEPLYDDQLKGHKYPYIASEILKSDIPFILKRFILSEEEYYKEYKDIFDEIDKNKNENKDEDKGGIININNDCTNSYNYKDKDSPKNIIDCIISVEREVSNDKNIYGQFYGNENENNEEKNNIINKEDNKIEKNSNENNISDKTSEVKENENQNINLIKEENSQNKDIINEKILNDEENNEKAKNNELKIEEENPKNIENSKNIIKEEKNDNIESIIKDDVDSVSLDENDESDVKESSKKININPRNQFLDLLLDFVMNDKQELNYVLSGYFSSIIMTLLEKYPDKLLKYLYEIRQDALQKILFLSHQRVFSILSSKLLNLENYSIKESNYIRFRNELIGRIIKSISLDGYKDEYDNLYINIDMESKINFIETIINDNKYVVNYILENNDIYGHILNILNINLYNEEFICDNNFDNKYLVYGLFINLIIKLLKSSYTSEKFQYPKEFTNNCTEKEKSELSFNEYMIICFCNIIKYNFLPKKPKLIIEPGTTMEYEGFGILNYNILDLIKEMFSFMKEIPNILDSILINNDFCQKSIDYFFIYQWNNIYHIKFIELFIIYLNEEIKHKELTTFFFDKIKFHEILVDFLKEKSDKQKYYFEFKSKCKIKSALYAQIIDLCYKLQVFAGLKTFTDEEKNNLKILNLGEFEFLKNENSNKLVKTINISTNIANILKESKEWNEVMDNIIMPLIKKYEGQLNKKEEKKEEKPPVPEVKKVERNSRNNDIGIDMLLNFINSGDKRKSKAPFSFADKSMDIIRNKIIMKEMKQSKKKKKKENEEKNEKQEIKQDKEKEEKKDKKEENKEVKKEEIKEDKKEENKEVKKEENKEVKKEENKEVKKEENKEDKKEENKDDKKEENKDDKKEENKEDKKEENKEDKKEENKEVKKEENKEVKKEENKDDKKEENKEVKKEENKEDKKEENKDDKKEDEKDDKNIVIKEIENKKDEKKNGNITDENNINNDYNDARPESFLEGKETEKLFKD